MTKPAWPFEQFHHVHVIVPDLDRASNYLAQLGLPMTDYSHPSAGGFEMLDGVEVSNFNELGYRYADCGGVHLQLMSPGPSDSPHKRFIEENGGPRLFSAGFVVEHVDEAEAVLIERGLNVAIRGRHENGWGFTYFDTISWLGFNLCIRQSPRIAHADVPPTTPDTVFSRFQHVCAYVDNERDALTHLDRIGLHMNGYPHRAQGDFELLEGMAREAFWKLGYQHTRIGDVHFQVMAPGPDDTPQKRFVDQYGRRAYSIGFYVDDIDLAEITLIERGAAVIWKGRHQNGWGFSYFDTFKELGIHLCIRTSPRE